jgi:hypothetical protein
MAASRRTSSQLRSASAAPAAPHIEPIPIDQLLFDEKNPRIAERLGPRPTQNQIRDILIGEMEARELVPSFIANGYLPYEPLVVRPQQHNKYVVLEGNRRLAALRSMGNSDDKAEKAAFENLGLGKVPCLIFHGDEKQEVAYLGLRHLSKTKDWGAAAKAAFVERVLRDGVGLAEAGRLTNTTRSALRLLLLVRHLFERAGELGIDLPSSTAEGEIAFWQLGDAARRTNTKHYLELVERDDPLEQPDINEERFERLVGWIYGSTKTRQTKLIQSIRDIPTLDECLGHPKSTTALEDGRNLEDAKDELLAAGAKVATHLGRAKSSVQRATGALSDLESAGLPEVRGAREDVGKAIELFDAALRAIKA